MSQEHIVAQATHKLDQLSGELETLVATVRNHRPQCNVTPQDVCPTSTVFEYVKALPPDHTRQLLIAAIVIAARLPASPEYRP